MSNQTGIQAKECLRFETRPLTPHEIRKYRKSYFSEPGVRVTHPGSIDDEDMLRERLSRQRLGYTADQDSDHVPDIFTQGDSDSITAFYKEQKESIYKSYKREPLGKPYKRGHVIPPNIDAFGTKSTSSESAKDLIYGHCPEDSEEHRTQYIRSHGSYQPGEQRRRGYNWANNVDPKTHRFGVVEKSSTVEGVAICMQPEEALPQPRVTSINVENAKAVNSDKLGRSRNLGMLPVDVAFGQTKQPSAEPEWTAEQCIQGAYSKEEQNPDKDLGKAIKKGWRNDTSSARTFGCPTVRTDIPRPTRRSIGDHNNYGDDTNACRLLHPSRFSTVGLDDTDFTLSRPELEIKEIFLGIGYVFSDDEFATHCSRACEIGRRDGIGGRDGLCVESFRSAITEEMDRRDEEEILGSRKHK